MVKISCNIDNVFYKTKPTGQDIGIIVKRLKRKEHIREVTAEELSQLVTIGYSFTTAALNGTKEKNFCSQQLAIVDIDNERKDIPIMTIEDSINILENNKINYSFIYYTFNHSSALPKFRIVCILDEPITDPNEAKRLNQYIIFLFPQADKACHDLNRLYLGSNKEIATEVYDRTTKIIVPENFNPKEEKKVNTKNPKPSPKQETPCSLATSEFDNLEQAIKEFNLLQYIEKTTGTQGTRIGTDVLINPCPYCQHFDHFYIDTDRNIYYSHSDKDIGREKGNIINYLENINNWDRQKARDYFLYHILKQNKNEQKAAYKQAKEQERSKIKFLNDMGKLDLAYLTVHSTKTYPFYMIPKEIINNPVFSNMDYSSKLLYCLMLSRASLSAKNPNFIDNQGNIFIIYTIKQIMETMSCSVSTATKMLKQLDDIGLIEKKRQGQGKPTIIYVMDFSTLKSES